MTLVSESFEESWMLRDDKGNNIFDFYLEFPARLGFYYSRYGAWGDWARLITIESLAAACDGVVWDDATGQKESWQGEPEKFSTFKKYINRQMGHIPLGTRTMFRMLAWMSKPRGVK